VSTTPVTFDPNTIKPIEGAEVQAPSVAPQTQALQSAVSYASQQSPDHYAKLLRFQQLTGVPPAVSAGNEKQVQDAVDANKLRPEWLTEMAPATTAWAANPDNAAVSGVDEIHRLAGIEQNAVSMRAYTPTTWDSIRDKVNQAYGFLTGGQDLDTFKARFYQNPITRFGVDVVGGAAGLAGNVGSFFGWHGDRGLSDLITGQGSPKNILQRIETNLSPEMNTDPASLFHKSNEGDWLAKNVAPMIPAMLATGGTSLIADTLGVSKTAAKVLAGLATGGMFTADQGGRTFTQVAESGGSDYQARLAANRTAAINVLPNALFGATEVTPLLRDNPLLTSLGIGSITGAAGQASQNIVTGQPWQKDLASAAVQGAAVQGGLHLGTVAFFGGLNQAVEAAAESPLRERSPGKFQEAMQQVFSGDEGLRIPVDRFNEYFQSKQLDPVPTARDLGASNYAEAVVSGGDVTVPKANYLSQLDAEHQRGLLQDVVDPNSGLTAREHQEGRDELQQWASGGGPESLLQQTADTEAETESAPEFSAVKEDLRQRYVDAGETPEVADTLATKDAHAYSNIAKSANLKPSELIAYYNPKVTIGDAPEGAEALNQGSPDEPQGWFRTLPDGSYEIGRTKIGDLSTFVHEPAHGYLHIIKDLASREGASDTIKGDYEKIKDFLGVQGDEPLTREQQEKWAQANEQYLREGVAPSKSLKGAFQRFAIWLGTIYKKASDLGVELNHDIRGVFDRLYAAEEGVNRAEAEAGPRLFESPEEAGWTEEEFQKYADARGLEVDQAKAAILSKLNEAALRERSDEWREEARNARTAFTEQIDRMPEYEAIRALRKGELEDGTPLHLSREELVKQFGEDRVKALQKQHPGLYRTEGNIDAETAAEMLGFNSADQMMRNLEGSPRRSVAIDSAVRDYMIAKHGDVRYDGSLQDEVNLAVANEERAKNLHRELAALNRRNTPEFELREAQRELDRAQRAQEEHGKQQRRDERTNARIDRLKQRISELEDAAREGKQDRRAGAQIAQSVAPLEAYREAAQQMIEAKAAADLAPNRYLDASRKYGREAFASLAKGDYEEAKQAKSKELMNHFLFREATKAKEFIGKFEGYAKKSLSKSAQEKLGKAGFEYRDQFNKLLGRYGIGPGAQTSRTLADWTRNLFEDGQEPAIDPSLLDESRQISYRNAPISEVRALNDALVNVRRLASLFLGMDVNGRKIEFESAVKDMSDRAYANLKAKPQRVMQGNATAGEKAVDLVQRGDALLMRTERLMEWLDGGKEGPWHDNLWNLAADSQGNEYKLQADVTKSIGDALEQMTKEQRDAMNQKVTVPGIPETVTRHDLVSMAMNMGNAGNLDRLEKTFAAHGWDGSAIEAVRGMLTREEWKFVQGAWDSLKPLGEAQGALERRLTGLPPVMVKPEPLHIDFPDGTSLDLDGGYYPIVMDPRYSRQGALQDAGTTAQNLMEAGYGRATTSRGNMKERTGYGGPLQLDYEQVLTQHTAKVIKDITHREFMLAANKILLEPNIRQTLRDTLGPAYEEQMTPWLRTIVNDRNGSAAQGLGDVSRLLRGLRTNLTLAAISFKISTSLLQWTHAPRMLLSTNPGSYMQAMVDFMAHPHDITDQVKLLSPNEMAGRGANLDRDIRATLNGKEGLQKSIARIGSKSIEFTDHVMSYPLWLSVYRDTLKKHVDELPEQAQYHAVHAADSAVRLGLGSGAPKDLPPIMRNNDFTKFMTTFYSFHNGIYGQVRDIGHQFAANGGVGKLAYGLALSVLVPSVLSALVTGDKPKDGENPGLWAAKRALMFGGDTIPVIRDAVAALDRDGDVKFNPLMDVLSKGVKATQQLTSDKEDKDYTGIGLNYLDTLGELGGIPGTNQALKPLRYLNHVRQGEVDNPNLVDAFVGAPRKK
jgi:hypothetical protein